MKIIKQQRVIRPAPGSKAKEKKGVFIRTSRVPETIEDIREIILREASLPSNLSDIINQMSSYLDEKGKPSREHVVFFNNGDWHYIPEEISGIEGFINYGRKSGAEFIFDSLAGMADDKEQRLVGIFSPEYFAMKAISSAKRAASLLTKNEKKETESMLSAAMLAVDYFHKFLFAEQWELLVLGGLSQKVKKTPRDNSWAKKMAKYLKKKYPNSTFSERWSAIPDDEEWDGWAVEFELDKVSGEKVALLAEYVKDDKVKKKPQRITKETFRTDYMTDRKKKNKK